jgi:hypothetical protein
MRSSPRRIANASDSSVTKGAIAYSRDLSRAHRTPGYNLNYDIPSRLKNPFTAITVQLPLFPVQGQDLSFLATEPLGLNLSPPCETTTRSKTDVPIGRATVQWWWKHARRVRGRGLHGVESDVKTRRF